MYTRKKSRHQIPDRPDDILTSYFNSEDLANKGLPVVQFICATLNVSVSNLSILLKVFTGQSTQQHIHDKLIEKAKEKLSVSEMGFEHPQSFSKLFKVKNNLSPLEFRASFI